MESRLNLLFAITNSQHSFGPFADGWTDQKNKMTINTQYKKNNKKNIFTKKETFNDDFIKFQWPWIV